MLIMSGNKACHWMIGSEPSSPSVNLDSSGLPFLSPASYYYQPSFVFDQNDVNENAVHVDEIRSELKINNTPGNEIAIGHCNMHQSGMKRSATDSDIKSDTRNNNISFHGNMTRPHAGTDVMETHDSGRDLSQSSEFSGKENSFRVKNEKPVENVYDNNHLEQYDNVKNNVRQVKCTGELNKNVDKERTTSGKKSRKILVSKVPSNGQRIAPPKEALGAENQDMFSCGAQTRSQTPGYSYSGSSFFDRTTNNPILENVYQPMRSHTPAPSSGQRMYKLPDNQATSTPDFATFLQEMEEYASGIPKIPSEADRHPQIKRHSSMFNLQSNASSSMNESIGRSMTPSLFSRSQSLLQPGLQSSEIRDTAPLSVPARSQTPAFFSSSNPYQNNPKQLPRHRNKVLVPNIHKLHHAMSVPSIPEIQDSNGFDTSGPCPVATGKPREKPLQESFINPNRLVTRSMSTPQFKNSGQMSPMTSTESGFERNYLSSSTCTFQSKGSSCLDLHNSSVMPNFQRSRPKMFPRRIPSEPAMRKVVLERQQVMSHKHIAIDTWLEALGMKEYYNIFSEYSGVEEILHLTEADVRDMGVISGPHRSKIVSSLRILKDKYEKGYKVQRPLQRSHSATAQLSAITPTTPKKPSYPDYQFVNVSSERLERDLVAELTSNPSELKHWPWYHGSIARIQAERLVHRDGDFLVRDCNSSPGDFVLTCCWKGVPLHFVINSCVTECENNKCDIFYHFEDDQFRKVQDLIKFYMDYKNKVTKASGAVISNPIARSMPLSYYDSKYGNRASLQGNSDYAYTPTQSPHSSPYISPTNSPKGSPKSSRKMRPVRSGSQPILSLEEDEEVILRKHDQNKNLTDRSDSVPALPIQISTPVTKKTSIPNFHARAGSEPVLLPAGMYKEANRTGQYLNVPKNQMIVPSSSENDLTKPPPPKPSRIPSIKYKEKPKVVVRNIDLYQDDGRDYTDYSQVKELPSWTKHKMDKANNNSNDNESNHVKGFSNNQASVNKNEDKSSEINQNTKKQNKSESPKLFTIPPSDIESSIYVTKYSSDILQEENKPLDATALVTVKSLMTKTEPESLAQHLTKIDIEILKVMECYDFGMGVDSGMELMTLPQGKTLRQDVIERGYCLKVFAMVTILTGQTVKDRANMLNQWIQICKHLRLTFGNFFAFKSVMEALMAPQIQRLRDTWMVLRQSHTNSAFEFDTKHKPVYKSLVDGSGLLPVQNVSIPDVMPLVSLLERNTNNIMDYLPWELSDPNAGLDILLTHLDTARLITAQCGLYRVTAESVMQKANFQNNVLDILRTEFQLRLLWGYKGALVERELRKSKFELLLTALSNRAEPPGDDGTEL